MSDRRRQKERRVQVISTGTALSETLRSGTDRRKGKERRGAVLYWPGGDCGCGALAQDGRRCEYHTRRQTYEGTEYDRREADDSS